MQQDEFRTLAGFEEMSFDVSDEKAPMMVSIHTVSQTYLKFSVGYGLAESKKTDSRKACPERRRRDAKFGETVFFLYAPGGLARENVLQSFCQTFQTKESIRRLRRRRQLLFARS